MASDAIPFVSQTCEAGGRASGPTVPAGNAVLKCGLLAGLEIAAGTIEENNRRRIDYSGAPAQFDDVLTQAADLEDCRADYRDQSSGSPKSRAYSDMPSFSSESAICWIAAAPRGIHPALGPSV